MYISLCQSKNTNVQDSRVITDVIPAPAAGRHGRETGHYGGGGDRRLD